MAAGWVGFAAASVVALIATASLRLRSDSAILAIYALGLIPSIVLIAGGTWRLKRSRGWSAVWGALLAVVQVAAILAGALLWLVVLALASSPYK